MPVATLKYNLPEEQEEFRTAMQGGAARSALWDIGQEVFRPARKHGYPDRQIAKAVEYLDSLAQTAAASEGKEFAEIDATELISLLEKKFYEILSENEVTME